MLAALVLAVALLPPLDVPYVRQSGNGCGWASVAMILQYWQPEKAVGERIADTMAKGSELERYLQQQGFQTHVINGTLEDLAHHTAKGRPLIVCLHIRNRTHFAVVTGVTADSVICNDPARSKAFAYSRDDFRKSWSRTGHWTLLAVPAP